MTDLTAALSKADSNLDASIERLCELVRIKSISTDPAYAPECRKAAQWLVDRLNELGFSASIRDTPGHPMVVAHHDGPQGAPHVLFYGHYDVQPVDPIALWSSDPFQPEIREVSPGRKAIFGRGTSDDKGSFLKGKRNRVRHRSSRFCKPMPMNSRPIWPWSVIRACGMHKRRRSPSVCAA